MLIVNNYICTSLKYIVSGLSKQICHISIDITSVKTRCGIKKKQISYDSVLEEIMVEMTNYVNNPIRTD